MKMNGEFGRICVSFLGSTFKFKLTETKMIDFNAASGGVVRLYLIAFHFTRTFSQALACSTVHFRFLYNCIYSILFFAAIDVAIDIATTKSTKT